MEKMRKMDIQNTVKKMAADIIVANFDDIVQVDTYTFVAKVVGPDGSDQFIELKPVVKDTAGTKTRAGYSNEKRMSDHEEYLANLEIERKIAESKAAKKKNK